MAGITIHGVVPISTIDSRERTSVLTDAGTIDAGLAISGRTSGVSLAVAREYERQVQELAWYSRHAGGVHIASTDHSIDDGLYELRDVRTSATPETSKTNLFAVSMTLRRLGGGPLGGNVAQRVRAQSTLQTNNYGITSTPRIAMPVGATSLNVGAPHSRLSKDGTISVFASGPLYALSGADYNTGECKLFDTRGNAAEADWQRVWSPDHVFSDPGHLVIENGLLRITGLTSGNKSSHRYWVWTGSAYTEVSHSTNGDNTYVNGNVTTAPSRLLIEAISPWRARVVLTTNWTGGFLTKTLTLERGKPLAQVELSVLSATVLLAGLVGGGRWVFTKGSPLDVNSDMQRPAFDDSVETGDVTLNAPEDNWAAMFTTKSSSVGALGIVAWQSSGLNYVAKETGGFYHGVNSGTSLELYIGGVKYDTSSAQLEAEAGTLTAGATAVSTLAGASGAGNNQVELNGPGEQVDMATNLASIGGSTVLVLFRIAASTTAGGEDIDLIIRNTTAGSNLASVSRDVSEFAAANTWYWQAVVGTGWNGTDTLVARANCPVGATATFYVDQAIVVAIAGNDFAMQVDDVAAQALTESIVAAITSRQVF